jgi:hypothetical protein
MATDDISYVLRTCLHMCAASLVEEQCCCCARREEPCIVCRSKCLPDTVDPRGPKGK